jgi:hypothetical protein
VYPFKAVDNLESLDSVRAMHELIHDPASILMSLLHKMVKKMTLEFIITTGADFTVLKNCVTKSIPSSSILPLPLSSLLAFPSLLLSRSSCLRFEVIITAGADSPFSRIDY